MFVKTAAKVEQVSPTLVVDKSYLCQKIVAQLQYYKHFIQHATLANKLTVVFTEILSSKPQKLCNSV